MTLQKTLKKICSEVEKLSADVQRFKKQNDSIDYHSEITKKRFGRPDFFSEISTKNVVMKIINEKISEKKGDLGVKEKEALSDSIKTLRADFEMYGDLKNTSDEVKKLCKELLADLDVLEAELGGAGKSNGDEKDMRP